MSRIRRLTLAAPLLALIVGLSTPLRAQSPEDGFNPGANDRVNAVAVQPDGKILLVGSFTTLGGGGTGTTSRSRIARLNADGSLDGTFDPGANDSVTAVAVQPDGKIVVAGTFTLLGGGGSGTTPRGRLARLNSDGSLDATFDPGANDTVTAVAVQPDGKVLVAGSFTTLGGGGTGLTPRNRIGRLNSNGSLDTSFNPGANDVVGALAVQVDGRIVVGGFFTLMGGGGTGTTPRNRIARLASDGTVDATFNPGANGFIATAVVQGDGKILLGGGFTTLGGGGTGTTPLNYIGRLNPNGSLDATFNPGANATVHVVAVQPDGQILVGGIFTTLGGGGAGTAPRNRIGRLSPGGSLDTNFNPGANDAVAALAVRPDGRILVGGIFTMLGGAGSGTKPRNNIGQLLFDGSLDVDFSTSANHGTPCCAGGETVNALAVQPDGKILVGGIFTELGNAAGSVVRRGLGRLNPDGTVDPTFITLANNEVYALAVQPDGKILVGGIFTALGDATTGIMNRSHIGRLNIDGTVDLTFDPGANGEVFALVVQANGQILVGGAFDQLGGGGSGTTARSRIGRLNADGSIDAAFDPGANGPVRSIAVQPNGQILVGGNFTLLGGTATLARNYIGRLESNGSLDGSFDPGANRRVLSVVAQSDGRILLGGSFDRLGGGGSGATTRFGIGRLFADGSLDPTFNPGANGEIWTIAVQIDKQILVGGDFTLLGGGGSGTTARNFMGRLSAAGVVDPAFDPNPNVLVNALALQADGRILVGGQFTAFGPTQSTLRYRIARLSNSQAAVQSHEVTCMGCQKPASGTPSLNATVLWTRSGAGPEVDRVTFDFSGDGVSYFAAGVGTRVGTEWRLTRETGELGQSFFVRARGYYRTGLANGSGSIVESIRKVNISCPTLATVPLIAGRVDVAYTTTFTTSDALGLVSFSTASALPAGITLSSAGVLAGTPTQTGTFPLTVTATDASSGCAASGAYTLTIHPPPTMTLDKTALGFGAVTTAAAFVSQTAAQIVRLTQTGTGTVTWTAVSNQPWLLVGPASGTGSANLSISVMSVGGLPAGGAVAGTVSLTVTGASNMPGPIAVTLTLIPNGTSTSPFGVVDTPADNTTGVTGAIPFTGWALDDVEVTRVTICRAASGTEVAPVDPNCGGAAQIFLGSAVFIDGARPDVLAAYPNAPVNTRAGWGFMVLTNMLPNQGNGTYLFYMRAQDRDGNTTLLGTRTMTCANASATKPFGAIDTPTQGGNAAGASFLNFGWALTPQPKLIPIDGSTITVLVDGTSLGTVNYNHERPDIEALFPGYQNTAGANGAVGFRAIDTTTLTNGLHTISWTVVDDHGAIEGIGSRYFTVANGVGAPITAAMEVEGAAARRGISTSDMIFAAPRDDAPVLGRRGWDLDGPWRWYGVGAAGRAVMRGEEIDRFEVLLGDDVGTRYSAHLRAGGGLAPLPIGSQLDATTGQFTWAPGVGFVGTYDLVFVRWEGTQAVARHEVRIILAPKGRGHVGVQVAIDTPRSQQDVGQPFVLAGWAADLDAAEGPGIDTLHVWAYPSAGGAPVFLGTPALGGIRPDVAAVHGDQFKESGFALPVHGLAPGNYDLAVFPWSRVTDAFAPPKLIHVTVR